jgi:translation initiation factor IF-1
MNKEFLEFEGKVIEILPSNYYKVKLLKGGFLVRASIENNLRNIQGKRIKIMERDKVKIKIPIEDLPNLPSNSSKGRISGLLK